MTRHVAPHETRPARLEPLDRLPVFFDLAGKRAVVVGSGTGAAWKAELLAAAGAAVEVYAPEPGAELLAFAAEPGEGAVRIERRRWTAADLAGAAIAVGAPDDPAEAAALAAAARAAGVPLNVVDHPRDSDFQFGAIVNRSPVVIGISTAGGAPVLAQAVRRRIEAVLPRRLGAWGRAAQALRARLKVRLPDMADRRRFWDRFAAAALAADAPPDQGRLDALAAEPEDGAGRVTLVGAGPGDPELLTLKAVRALQAADVIVYDRLVGAEDILELGRREVRRIAVGKEGHGESCRQEEINGLLLDLAGQGLSVVRLKGGDPMVFGRAGEEIAALAAAGIAVTVIPGITAALGAAAALGTSLSHRDHARRIQFVTGHDRHGRLAPDLDYAALADPAATTAVYMGRGTAAELAARLIAEELAAATPVAIVANVSAPTQRLDRTDLAALAAAGAGDGREPVVILIGTALGEGASVREPIAATA